MYRPLDWKREAEGEGINLKEICRLCRTPRGVMSYIFGTPGVDASVPLPIRIMKFANIQLREGDGLPALICHRCLYHIEKANEFREQCEQSDALLRQYMLKQIKETEKEASDKPQNLSMNSTGVQCDGLLTEHGFIFENNFHVKKEVAEVENLVMVVDPSQTMDDSDTEHHSDPETNELNCPSCNKNFDTKENLGRHLHIHTQDGPFPCDYCETVVGDKGSLKAHWRQVHADSKPHLCLTCGEAFLRRESLIEHNAIHNKVKPFHCSEPTCNKAFAYRSDLRKHSVIHTGIRPYVCPVCYKSFTRSTNLNKHARLHTGRRPFSCDSCKKMFASRGDLVRHSVIHTGEKPYSCAICSLSFNRKDKLSRHEKLHKGERAHACSECPTSFHRKEELTKHIQFHHYSPVLFDDDDFSDGKEMSDSVNGNHDGDHVDESSETNKEENGADSPIREEVKGPCETEDLVISVDPSHWDETKAQCDVCHKFVTDARELLKHKTLHSKTRDYVCEICSKGFHQRRELVRHSVIHTGFKPHSCPTCGKAFSRRDKLTRHMRTHTLISSSPEKPEIDSASNSPDSPNICEVCCKEYSSKHELVRHMVMQHSIGKPYHCGLCSAAYCRKDKLAKHIKLVHPEPDNEPENT